MQLIDCPQYSAGQTTSTPACQPSANPVYGWRKSFVEANIKDFCDKAEQEGFSTNVNNPLWREETYAANNNSDPSNHDLSIYIHYEQHACASGDDGSVLTDYKPTSQQCQDQFAWLWKDPAACGEFDRASQADSSDIGPRVPPGGYYGDCMWWQLRDSGTEQGYSVTPTAPVHAMITPTPDLTHPGYFVPASNGRCERFDTVH